MPDRRGAGSSLIAGLLCLIVLIAYAWSVSAGRLTHGFVAYHTASQLLLERQMGPQVYDFAWFQQQITRRTATGVLEIFSPNPPTMALLALPVAAFDPRTARALWLVVLLVAVSATTILLARDAHQRQARWLPAAIVLVLLSPAVLANIRTAQAYLIVGVGFTGAALALRDRRDAMAGFWLGLTVILKMTGVPWLLVLAMLRRWRALGVAIATAALVAVVTLPWTGLETWRAYPAAIASFVARPTTGITAYQTTLGFMRHWCGPDARAMTSVADCSARATLTAWLLLGIAVVITGLVVRRAPPMLASAAGVCLSLLCIPIAEDHQFVLLAIPIFVLLATPPRWHWVVVAVLVLVPAELTVERYRTGLLSLLAYPRLYATWCLWALTIHAIWHTTRRSPSLTADVAFTNHQPLAPAIDRMRRVRDGDVLVRPADAGAS